jgi:hypothetical protein
MEDLIAEVLKLVHRTNDFIYYKKGKKKLESFDNIFDIWPELLTELTPESREFYYSSSKGVRIDITDEICQKAKVKKSGGPRSQGYFEELEEFQSKYKVCLDVYKDDAPVFLWDKDNKKISELSAKSILSKLYPKDARDIRAGAIKAKVVYDAYDIRPYENIMADGSTQIAKLNMYKPPTWRQLHPTPEDDWGDTLPLKFEILMSELFPDKEEREIVESWVCNALTKRHQSYLSLRGPRGVGKTLFAKVIAAVIGDPFICKELKRDESFNAEFKHKRVIIIDDDKYIGTKEGYYKRKHIINSNVTYSEKYVQTTQSETNFSSFIVCSNPEDYFYEEYDDRRIVSVTLGKKNAEEYMETKYLRFFDTILDRHKDDKKAKTQQFLAKVGHYFLRKAPHVKYGDTHCYKGGHFWDDVIKSLTEYMSYIVRRITNEGEPEYEFIDLEEDYKASYQTGRAKVHQWRTVKEILNKFEYKGEKIIECVVGDTKEDAKIIVAPKFVKQDFMDI